MTKRIRSMHCTKMTLSTCSQWLLVLFMSLGSLALVPGCRNASISAVGQPEARETAPDATSATRDPERRVPRKLARDANEPLACGADADCVITCRTDGRCCLEQCGCSQPMSRSFLARLETHLSAECGPDPLCPVAGCVGTKLNEPRCENGQCTARKLPGGI